MKLKDHVNLIDLVVAIVVVIVIVLPPRSMNAVDAAAGTDAERVALATAEARAQAWPSDGAAAAELSRQLVAAGHLDWAVESAAKAAERTTSPTKWRALIAVSVAYAERLDVVPARDWARIALDTCRAAGPTVCPSWEEVRMDLFFRHLHAGVESGIDPRKDPDAFRAAGESGLRTIRIAPDPGGAP